MMFNNVLSLDEIKKEPFVIENIRWDLEPKDLMEPRQKITGEGVQTRDTIKGYVFYIDTMAERPILFLMRHTAADYAETLAQIDEIPQELLAEAVEENKAKAYFGMYPVNKKVEAWLKKELGVL
ncbi:MAG: hypothetical protein M1147_03260 [Nitrospirae bacterium]|nr:hypothetical protein [Nitrospirota bacterium]MCL5977134.1 hypothetical protein [Nitrospirota bacterium]